MQARQQDWKNTSLGAAVTENYCASKDYLAERAFHKAAELRDASRRVGREAQYPD